MREHELLGMNAQLGAETARPREGEISFELGVVADLRGYSGDRRGDARGSRSQRHAAGGVGEPAFIARDSNRQNLVSNLENTGHSRV